LAFDWYFRSAGEFVRKWSAALRASFQALVVHGFTLFLSWLVFLFRFRWNFREGD